MGGPTFTVFDLDQYTRRINLSTAAKRTKRDIPAPVRRPAPLSMFSCRCATRLMYSTLVLPETRRGLASEYALLYIAAA